MACDTIFFFSLQLRVTGKAVPPHPDKLEGVSDVGSFVTLTTVTNHGPYYTTLYAEL